MDVEAASRESLQLFSANPIRHSEYDAFMLRLHQFLKGNDELQERARKKFRHFAPGTAWLAFTDGFCHARPAASYTLEHSFFVKPQDLVLPELSRSPCGSGAGGNQSAHRGGDVTRRAMQNSIVPPSSTDVPCLPSRMRVLQFALDTKLPMLDTRLLEVVR